MLHVLDEFKDFLLTGILGDLNVRTLIYDNDVISAMGKPNQINESDRGVSGKLLTLEYSCVLFYFMDRKFESLEIYFQVGDLFKNEDPCVSKITWYESIGKMDCNTIKKYLKENQIHALRALPDIQDLSDEGLSELIEIQETGILIYFDENGTIEQIYYTPSRLAKYRYEEI